MIRYGNAIRVDCKRSLSALVLILGLLWAMVVAAQPDDDAPPYWLGERGPYSTGTILETWSDESRGEFTTRDPQDRRRLVVQIWYPAEPGAEGERAPYAINVEDYAERLRGVAGAPPTASVLQAPLSSKGEAFPVLTVSHGDGTSHFLLTYITEYLASHGYVVAAIGHTGFNGLERFPDGEAYSPDIRPSIVPEEGRDAKPEGRLLDYFRARYEAPEMVERNRTLVEDLSFVLDQLEDLNADTASRFHGRLDIERIGAVGFSLGGATAFQATLSEPRIDAAVNMDGDLQGRSVIEEGAAKPVLLLADIPPQPVGQTDAEELEARMYNLQQRWRLLSNTEPHWYHVAIPGVDHSSFGDHYFGLPRPQGIIPPQQAHPIIKDLVLTFLDRYVKKDMEASLLPLHEKYPGISIATNAGE